MPSPTHPRDNLGHIRRQLDEAQRTFTALEMRPHESLRDFEYRVKGIASKGRGNLAADLLFCLLMPNVDAAQDFVHRSESQENMQRLTLAILLYQIEHGKLPDTNWAEQIAPYLGEKPERYFSCPSRPSPEGQTTYALVQYGDTLPADLDTILLVELAEPVPLNKAVISVDEVLEHKRTGDSHRSGMNVAFRSGAVRFLTSSSNDEELRRMLGRE